MDAEQQQGMQEKEAEAVPDMLDEATNIILRFMSDFSLNVGPAVTSWEMAKGLLEAANTMTLIDIARSLRELRRE